MKGIISIMMGAALLIGCTSTPKQENNTEANNEMKNKVEEFAPFRLTTDLSVLTEKEKQMLAVTAGAAQIMDDIFWTQAYGDKDELFTNDLDEYTKKFLEINYGPWERLNNNQPFIEGVGQNLPALIFTR
jgi:PBP1b-binding outer membrane lipoprotein LpoB